jgi:hypothetical protein
MVVFAANFCNAQASGPLDFTNSPGSIAQPWPEYQPKIPQEATNWGVGVRGVQLLLYPTNTVIDGGSSITVLAVIRNTSTNSIQVIEKDAERNFDLLLTNVAGKVYHLTPHKAGRNLSMEIVRGTQLALNIPVTFRSEIEPGDYTLKATRLFWMEKDKKFEKFEIESNLLKVQVK